uniref:RRM domain-containing protein n=1 Tax=Araucaria cunninghamii TaxID=56994 RepID=A0A0D6R5H4_ARACU
MANLLSELERFEQEMKELVSDSNSPTDANPANINTSSNSAFQSSSETSTLTAAPSPNGTVVQSTAPAQQLSRPPAPPASSVGTISYIAARPSPIISSGAQLQPQVSAPPAPSGLSLPAAPHLQWVNGGAGPAPVPPVSASTSSQFTYSSGAYPPGPSNVPSVSATATSSGAYPPGPSNVPSVSVTSTSGASYFPLPFHLQQQADHLQQQPQPEQQYAQQQPYLMPQYQPQVQKYPLAPQPQQPAPIQPPQYPYSSLYQAPAGVGGIYSLPQQQQAQQLFQKDAQTITPEALESVKAALASSENEHKAETKKKAIPRKAAGQTWEDPTLAEWPENDFRLFCGDLGNEVNDEVLTKAFSRYATFNMARVVRDKRTGKTKGYGFVSFSNPSDLASALKEMNGKYVGNRPIKLRKSNWKERTDFEAWEKHKMHGHKKGRLSKKTVLHK